jgi:transposase-like protein
MMGLSCPNRECPLAGKAGFGNIIGHGFYKTKWGRRHPYRCGTCGKTFCSNSGTPYYRLQHRRATFDEVAALSVEGLNKSAIARVKGIGGNTVDRWLEKAAASCRRFKDRKITGVTVAELRVDEIRTIILSQKQPIWIFAAIEVWSRFWPSTVVGHYPRLQSPELVIDAIKDALERCEATSVLRENPIQIPSP